MALRPTRLTTLGDRIAKRLEAVGFTPTVRPDGTIPELPKDVTTLTSQAVGRLLGVYNAWLAYITPKVMQAKIDFKEAKVNEANAKRLKKPPKLVNKLARLTLEAEAWYLALEGLEKATTRKKETTSREISRFTDNTGYRGDRPEPETR